MKLRNATSEDFDFLYRLHRAAMKDYVVQTWGWDETWQQSHFRQHFNPTARQIISVAEKDVGVLIVEESETEIHLSEVEILPEYQNQGIGTSVLKMVLEEAESTGKTVALQVLKVNPARSLYERHGFIVTGETTTHYLMERRAIP